MSKNDVIFSKLHAILLIFNYFQFNIQNKIILSTVDPRQ